MPWLVLLVFISRHASSDKCVVQLGVRWQCAMLMTFSEKVTLSVLTQHMLSSVVAQRCLLARQGKVLM